MKHILLFILVLLIGAKAYDYITKEILKWNKPAPLQAEVMRKFQLEDLNHWGRAQAMAHAQIRHAEGDRNRGEFQSSIEDHVSALGGAPARSIPVYSTEPNASFLPDQIQLPDRIRAGGVSFSDSPSIKSGQARGGSLTPVVPEPSSQTIDRSRLREEGRQIVLSAAEATREAQSVLIWIEEMQAYYASRTPLVPMREWTGTNGHKRKFSVIEWNSIGDGVIVRFPNKEFAEIGVQVFSEEDRRFLLSKRGGSRRK